MSYNIDIEARRSKIDHFIKNQNEKLNIEIVSSFKDYQLAKKQDSVVVVEDGLRPAQILEMCIHRGLKNVVQNSKMSIEEKLKLAQKMLKSPIDSLNFGFTLFENPEICNSFSFSSDTNRTELVTKVLSALNIDFKNHNQQHITTSAEELIMNAQVHAPRYGAFRSPHHMSFLTEKKNDYVALSVFDDYGTLVVPRFLNKILNTFTVGVKEAMNFGSGGAGLGSSIIFSNAEVLYLGVLPKRITRATVLCPLKKREKEKDLEQKSIHIIDTL